MYTNCMDISIFKRTRLLYNILYIEYIAHVKKAVMPLPLEYMHVYCTS